MSTNLSVILHWYSASPFSQKVAWALNYKKVDYKLVVTPMIEPRPERRPIDGGYRKTPVLQIGNHTFCDSKIIFAELEKRFPEPSFYPLGPQGESTKVLTNSLARWLDNSLFMSVVTQLPVAVLDDDLLKDRAAFSGKSLDREMMKNISPLLRPALSSELVMLQKLVSERTQDGKKWALGIDEPSLLDFHIAMISWFTASLAGIEYLKKTAPLLAGHLEKTLAVAKYDDLDDKAELEPTDAIEVTKNEKFDLVQPKHDGTLPLPLGELVAVIPTDTGMVPSVGKLVHSTIEETVIEHHNKDYGTTVFIHFPTIGFMVTPLQNKL
ncbi:hypothetical protein BY458DRAFT_500290 [Sporodiniella umbellata]|nr:hypothetical protein BY458DRAFT_500290 [Sporodiniella umbellata]